MTRYEPSIPLRAAFGIAAVGMSAVTLSLLLIVPLHLASAGNDEAVIAEAAMLNGVPSVGSDVTIRCTTSDPAQPQNARHT